MVSPGALSSGTGVGGALGLIRTVSPVLSSLVESFELETLVPNLTPLGDDGFWRWSDVPYRTRGAQARATGGTTSIGRSTDPKHMLDVYVPSAPFPRPLLPTLMFWHGGGWQRGDKEHRFNTYGNVGIAAARAGYVGIVANYRLSPHVTHPEHVRDVAAAIKWARDNVRTFGGNGKDLFLCGHSAGAHLAALAACQPRWLAEAGMEEPLESVVSGVIGLCGVYNLPRLANTPLSPYLVEPAFGADPAHWRQASVTHQCGPASPLRQVPLLLVNAAEDFNLEQDAEELECRLRLPDEPSYDAGDEAADFAAARPDPGSPRQTIERHVVAPSNHVTLIGAVGQPEDHTTELIVDFIERHRRTPRSASMAVQPK